MPRVVESTVYKFSELSDGAKERAREWYRNALSQDIDYSFLYDDFIKCGNIIGIGIDSRTARGIAVTAGVMKAGAMRSQPSIYWSGFSSQGDGACFEGSYAYVKGAAKAIREHAPAVWSDDKGVEHKNAMNARLHEIADRLQATQAESFYRITADVRHRGHYYHEHCTVISIDGAKDRDSEERIADALRDFMRWMYRSLEAEYDWQMSDESVDESILANEYEFEEDGERA